MRIDIRLQHRFRNNIYLYVTDCSHKYFKVFPSNFTVPLYLTIINIKLRDSYLLLYEKYQVYFCNLLTSQWESKNKSVRSGTGLMRRRLYAKLNLNFDIIQRRTTQFVLFPTDKRLINDDNLYLSSGIS